MIKFLTPSELERTKWKELLTTSPAATFFHTVEWAQLWEESYAFFKSFFLVDVAEDGRYLAGLPFIRARKGLDNYYSMPMGSYGGVVSTQSGLEGALFTEWLKLAKRPRTGRMMVFTEQETLALEKLGFQKTLLFCHHLDLPAQGRPVFTRSLENRFGEALQAGFSFVRIEKIEDLHRFFSFSGRERKKTFYTKTFYQKLAQIFFPTKQAAWFLALRERRTAGYLLCFPYREELFLWDADIDPEFSKLGPGYFLFARVLDWAANKGFKRINFGQTPEEAKGALEFKERMGGKARPVFEYTYSTPVKRKLRAALEAFRGRR